MSAKEHSLMSLNQEQPKSNVPIVGRLIPSQYETKLHRLTNAFDADLLDWIEKHRAQIWFNRYTNKWVCQVMYHPHVIQPSHDTLRMAIVDAKSQFEKLKYPRT